MGIVILVFCRKVEKPTHVDPVRRFQLTLDAIFILTHFAKI